MKLKRNKIFVITFISIFLALFLLAPLTSAKKPTEDLIPDPNVTIISSDDFIEGSHIISIFQDGTKIKKDKFNWFKLIKKNPKEPIVYGVEYLDGAKYNQSGQLKNPLDNITFRVEPSLISNEQCSSNQYYESCSYDEASFDSFIDKNNITNQTTTPVYPSLLTCLIENNFIFIWELEECQATPYAYDLTFSGSIYDLDPELQHVYDSSTLLIAPNRTEGSNLGARLETVGFYAPLNENAGTVALDRTIYNSVGAINGAVYNTTCGRDGSSCYTFDGSNDDIIFPDTTRLDYTEEFTIMAWANPDAVGEQGYVISRINAGGTAADGYSIWWNGAGDEIVIIGADLTAADDSDNVFTESGTWVHVAITFKDGTLTFYKDGVEAGIQTNSFTSNPTNDVILGDRMGGAAAATQFDGSIDDARIYGRALTVTEILEVKDSTALTKYEIKGDFQSFVFYNSTSTFWNTTFSQADYSFYGDSGLGIVTDDLVSFWKFNNQTQNATGNLAYDSTGLNNGTIIDAIWAEENGVIIGGYDFQTSDYIELDNAPLVNGPQNYTISAWFRNSNPGVIQAIFSQSSDAFHEIRMEIESDNKLTFATYESGALEVDGTSIVTDGKWHHGVIVKSGTTGSVYVDGVLEGSGAVKNVVGTDINTIGVTRDTFGGGRLVLGYVGSIDEVKVYDRAISSAEVSELYREGLSTAVNLSDPNLVSYWPLDGNVLDFKGSSDGTPIGAVNSTGISSEAMYFDGNDYLTINPTTGITGQEFSMTGWVKTTDTQGEVICNFETGSPFEGFTVAIGSAGASKLAFLRSNGTAAWRTDTGDDVTDGDWKFISVTTNTTHITFWQNAEFSSAIADTSSVGISTNNFSMGADCNAGRGRFLIGNLDEIVLYNDTLTQDEITEVYKAGLSQHANANITLETRTADSYNLSDEGLIAIWGFNNDTANGDNATYLIDYTGRYNGTLGGTVPVSWFNTTGVVSNNHIFNGGTYYNVTDFPSSTAEGLIGAASFTMSAWVNVPENQGGEILSRLDEGTTFKGFIFGAGKSMGVADKVCLWSGDVGGAGWTCGATDIDATGWHHVAATSNGTFISIYVDGVLDGTEESAVDLTTIQDFYIAARPANFFGYNLDEVRLYNRTLSQSEIQDLYELGGSHINWTDWQNSGVMTDGIANNNSGNGTFFQFKPIFNTADTDVSSYLLNHSVGPTENPSVTPPAVLPPNITDIRWQNITGVVNGTIVIGDNITINATVIDDTGDLDNVWIKIWQGAIGGVVIFTDFLTNIAGDLWSIDVPTNDSFNIGENNFTIFANDTNNLIAEQNETFEIVAIPVPPFEFARKLQIWRNRSSQENVSFVDVEGNWFTEGRVIINKSLNVTGEGWFGGNVSVLRIEIRDPSSLVFRLPNGENASLTAFSFTVGERSRSSIAVDADFGNARSYNGSTYLINQNTNLNETSNSIIGSVSADGPGLSIIKYNSNFAESPLQGLLQNNEGDFHIINAETPNSTIRIGFADNLEEQAEFTFVRPLNTSFPIVITRELINLTVNVSIQGNLSLVGDLFIGGEQVNMSLNYNQTAPANDYTDGEIAGVNTTSNIQNLINSTGVYSTFNTTYDGYVNINKTNASNYWDGMDTINTTQMEDNNGILNILESWLNGLYCQLIGCTITGDLIVNGDINVSQNINLQSGNITNILKTVYNISGCSDSEEGTFCYDADFDTMRFVTISGQILQMNQETTMPGKNLEGSTVLDGSIVYIEGATGINPNFKLARADNLSTSGLMGVVTKDCNSNQVCPVVYFGLINSLDTSNFTEGDHLYLSDSEAGNLTITPPDFPSNPIWVATAIRIHATEGSVFVFPRLDSANGITMNNLGLVGDFIQTDYKIRSLPGNGAIGQNVFTIEMNGTSGMDVPHLILQPGGSGQASVWTRSGIVVPEATNCLSNINRTEPGCYASEGNFTWNVDFNSSLSNGSDWGVTGDLDVVKDVYIGGNFTGNQFYGEMWFHNDSALNITIIDGTDEWYNISALDGQQQSGVKLNGFTKVPTDVFMTAIVSGRFLVNYHITGTGGVNNKYHGVIGINGVPQFNTEGHDRVSAGSDIIDLSGTGIIDINVNDKITLMVLNEDSASDFAVASAGVNLVRVSS